MSIRVLILVPLMVLLTGCSVQFSPYQRGLSPEEIDAFARQRFQLHEREQVFVDAMLNAVRDRNGEALTALLSPTIIAPTLERDLAGFYGQFPTRTPERIDMVTFQSNLNQVGTGPDTLTLKVEYVFVYENFAPVFLTVTGQAEGAEDIRAINVRSQTLDPSYWQVTGEDGTLRKVIRWIAIGTPITLVIAVSFWLANLRHMRRPIIWLITLLATTPTFAFDWATQNFSLLAPSLDQIEGIWRFEGVEWIVTGVQVTRGGDYHPWIITIGLPLGALWFLFKMMTGGVERRVLPGEEVEMMPVADCVCDCDDADEETAATS